MPRDDAEEAVKDDFLRFSSSLKLGFMLKSLGGNTSFKRTV